MKFVNIVVVLVIIIKIIVMNKEFIPYEQALALKELGFDEPCFGWWLMEGGGAKEMLVVEKCRVNSTGVCLAPLYQQAFRWFREKHNLFSLVSVDQTMEPKFCYALSKYADPYDWAILVFNSELYYTYEEAELACLNKLIELVKQ